MPTAHQLAMSLAATALAFMGTAAAQSLPIERVVVLDGSFAVVSRLDSPGKVLEFNEHWRSKVKQQFLSSTLKEATFVFKLDIKATEGGGRWLYRPDGYVYRLAHNEQSVYRVQSPEDFNALLAIPR